jgi:hypothetical protein
MEDKDQIIKMQEKKIAEQAIIISAQEQEIALLHEEIRLLKSLKK